MTNSIFTSTDWSGMAFTGRWRALSGEQIRVEEPATGELLGKVACASPDDVLESARLADEAQKIWAEMSYSQRATVFRDAAALLEANREETLSWIVRETGGIRPKAMFEIDSVLQCLHEAAAMQTQPLGLVLPSVKGRLSFARRVAHGVVGVISPFNFPLLLSARAVLPALATGNAVVLKPDPRTPISGGVLLALLLDAAGLPKGVFHMLPGGADVGEALVVAPEVGMISFTGSTAVGRRVGELAGKHLKKAALELGGKNALVVLDDANLDLAVSGGAWSSWLHQGQICMSAGRHLVHRALATEYTQRMAEKARALKVGDPYRQDVALGPIITEQQVHRVDRIVKESVAMGAKLQAGGSPSGKFYPATVLSNVTQDMPAFREEIFGPVVVVTTFENDAEAVAMANEGEYGLSAGIYTQDLGRGLDIARQLDVGLVHVNDQTVNDDGTMPMGGRGASGNGSRHGGPANWDEFTQWQWMTLQSIAPFYPI